MLAEKRIRVLSLLQQKMFTQASRCSLENIPIEVSTTDCTANAEWFYEFFVQREVENLNFMSIEDANVAYFVSGYIGRTICRRRKCGNCKLLLLANNKKIEKIENWICKEYMTLFAEANRVGCLLLTKYCFMGTALAVQSYTALSEDNEIKTKLLSIGNQCTIFTEEVQRLVFRSAAVLDQSCTRNHNDFKLIIQTAFNCFAKIELKRLNCKKAKPPAKMHPTKRKLNSKATAKLC